MTLRSFRTLITLTFFWILVNPAPAYAAGRSSTPIINTILSGKGIPKSSLGTNGDFYIDQKSFNFYGPKAKNRWPDPISLLGPVGPVGPAGISSGDSKIVKSGSSAAISNGTTVVGAKGETGSSGPVGPVGPIGVRGASGDKGDVGAQGAAGLSGLPGIVGATGAAGTNGFGSTGSTGATGATGAQGPVGPSQVKIFTLQSASGGAWNISTAIAAKSASAPFGNLEANKSYYFQIFLYDRLTTYFDPTSIVGAEVSSDSGTAITYDVHYGSGKYAASLTDTYYRLGFEITGTLTTGATPGTNLVVRMIDGSGWSATVGNTLTGRAYVQEVGAIL